MKSVPFEPRHSIRPSNLRGRAGRRGGVRVAGLLGAASLLVFAWLARSALTGSVSRQATEKSLSAVPSDERAARVAHHPADSDHLAGLSMQGIDRLPGLDNVLQVSSRIYSGSQPDGDDGFASLAKLGVLTVVSVDGSRPQVEIARRHGLRYVHIPIGYGGISSEAGGGLARLVREYSGPFYVHCHHGKHRGPAAAAIMCIASGAADADSARAILRRAGTSADYHGLWRAVSEYRPPSDGAELPSLCEVAEVGSLASAMAALDHSFDRLKLCRAANWQTPPRHPDIVAAHESLQIREAFREIARTIAANSEAEFLERLADAERHAASLESALRAERYDDAARFMELLENSCKACHDPLRR